MNAICPKHFLNRLQSPQIIRQCLETDQNSSQTCRIHHKSSQIALFVSEIIANSSLKSPNRLQIVTKMLMSSQIVSRYKIGAKVCLNRTENTCHDINRYS